MKASPEAILVERLDLGGGGPSVAIKECIDIAGHRTSCGSAALADTAPATQHAAVVTALLAGGAHIVGKANMHELAYGVTGVNGWRGTPINPKYPDLIPGGSSSGSAAAVAAGLADIAIGTDTGGSIRMPAACCGVAGLKPTSGRISRQGCIPAQSSIDCVGPFARDVAGIEQAMALIDPTYIAQVTPAHVTLGWIETAADADIAKAVASQLNRPEITLKKVELPGLEEAFQAGMTIIAAESWAAYAPLADHPALGADIRTRLQGASKITPDQLAEAKAAQDRFCTAVDLALRDVDAIVLPTLPTAPPTFEELGDAARVLRLTLLVRPFNLSGHPALTLPIPGPGGRPAGIQLVGRKNAEAPLCAVARIVEKGIAA